MTTRAAIENIGLRKKKYVTGSGVTLLTWRLAQKPKELPAQQVNPLEQGFAVAGAFTLQVAAHVPRTHC